MPHGVKGLIVRFALTDINVRRLYARLALRQDGTSNESAIDLTGFFWIGPNGVPSFGSATEVILPWSADLNQQLKVDITLPPTPGLPAAYSPDQFPPPKFVSPMQGYLNAISYGVFQITGFIY